MDKNTVLAQLKNHISGQWGEQNKELAAQLNNLTVKDISFAEPSYIKEYLIEYSCTGSGCIVGKIEDQNFPLTKSFQTSLQLYVGDDASVKRYLKDNSLSTPLDCVYDCESNVVNILRLDASKQLRSEFSMYNAIAESSSVKINNYSRNERSSFLCPYTAIYAILKDSNGQTQKQLIGYVVTKNGKETLEIDIEIKKSDSKKSMGCLIIGLGIFFPPLWIIYGIYWYLKKEKKI